MSRKFGNGGNPKSGYWVQVKNLEIFFRKIKACSEPQDLVSTIAEWSDCTFVQQYFGAESHFTRS